MHHEYSENIDSPIILTCEHASVHIPNEYHNLGLTQAECDAAKDLFDPGSLMLAQQLSVHLKTSLVSANFSRLLIDANRTLGSSADAKNTFHAPALKSSLMIEDEQGERIIPIPGNDVADVAEEEASRWNTYVRPYYEDIEKLATKLLQKFDTVYIFQIHSFYPSYDGKVRTVDIGVIHADEPLATQMVSVMQSVTNLVIGDNKPWAMSDVGGGVLEPLQKRESRIRTIGFDVNNKHLSTEEDVAHIAKILSDGIQNVL